MTCLGGDQKGEEESRGKKSQEGKRKRDGRCKVYKTIEFAQLSNVDAIITAILITIPEITRMYIESTTEIQSVNHQAFQAIAFMQRQLCSYIVTFTVEK